MARIWERERDFTFSGIDYTFGLEFEADTEITVEGVWYYVEPEDGPTALAVRLYDATTRTELASGPGIAMTPGAWNFLPFTVPYNAAPATRYTATIEVSAGLYAYKASGLPVVSPDGHVTAIQGRYNDTQVHGYPESTWLGVHGLDVEYELATSAEPHTGSASFEVVVDLEATGLRASAGSASFAAPVAVTAVGDRPSAGSADFPVAVAVTAVGWVDTSAHVNAPPQNSYRVPAEDRTWRVPPR